MDEQKARAMLGAMIQPNNSLRDASHYTDWAGGEIIKFDDNFELEELEAIIWWMRNMQISSADRPPQLRDHEKLWKEWQDSIVERFAAAVPLIDAASLAAGECGQQKTTERLREVANLLLNLTISPISALAGRAEPTIEGRYREADNLIELFAKTLGGLVMQQLKENARRKGRVQ